MLCGIVRTVQNRTERHPLFRIVRGEQGRSLVWLARQTGFSYPYVRAVSAGQEKGSPRFRAACAAVLGLPEERLFHAATSEGESTVPRATRVSIGVSA